MYNTLECEYVQCACLHLNSIHEQQNVTKRGIQTVVTHTEIEYMAVLSVIDDIACIIHWNVNMYNVHVCIC